ncbi:hypothetical protein ACFL0D_04400, partial [Thermoproteota archaeon]
AMIIFSRVARKERPPTQVSETMEPEKILVEKGFENNRPVELVEEESYIDPYETSLAPSEDEEINSEYTIEIESVEPIIIEEPKIEEEHDLHIEETVKREPVEPMIIEETEPPVKVFFEDQPASLLEQDLSQEEETVDFEPIESIMIEQPLETEVPPVVEERLNDIPDLEEPEIEQIYELELPPLEPYDSEPEKIESEIEPEKLEETYMEPLIDDDEEPEKDIEEPIRPIRLRKPVIDESDPALKIDLGVETCPHCGSKVPDTIYCILCGKSLDPNSVPEQE